MKRLLFFVLLLACIGVVSADYIVPIESLTVSPLDAQTTYLGWMPYAPNTSALNSSTFIPADGTITGVELYEYSGTAGTNEVYQYFIRVNDTTDYRIGNLSVAASERVWTNTSMSIPVVKGNFIQIKRIQPTWATNPATDIVGGYVYVNTTEYGYTLPAHSILSTPEDANSNSFGMKPIAVETTAGRNKIYIPQEGNITWAYAMNFAAATKGSNESHTMYLNVSGASPGTTIATVADNTTSRTIFYNNTLNTNVLTSNYIEWFRRNPTWSGNPTASVLGALTWINTSTTRGFRGIAYPVQALTSSPTDAQIVYFGNLPKAPTTTVNISKIYIRKNGTITRAAINVYSGTTGTNENWNLSICVNGATDYLIENIAAAAGERMFNNESLGIPIYSGDFIEIKGKQPTWATNPATTIYGGYVWMEYEVNASFSSNVTSGIAPTSVAFTDTSKNTPNAWNWSYKNVTGNNTEIWWSTAQNPIISFGGGNWSIKLNATNGDGYNITPGTYFVNVTTITAPVSDFTSNSTVGMVTLPVQFNDISTNTPTNWDWYFWGNETKGSDDQNPSTTFTEGIYNVRLYSSNAGGGNWRNISNAIWVTPNGTRVIYSSNASVVSRNRVNATSEDFPTILAGAGTNVYYSTLLGAQKTGFDTGSIAFLSSQRALYSFDLSSIPAGSSVTSVNLSTWGRDKWNELGGSPSVILTNASPQNISAHASSDYNKTGNLIVADNLTYSQYIATNSSYVNFTFNAVGKQYVTDAIGLNVSFMMRTSWDVNNAFGGVYSNNSELGFRTWGDRGGTSIDPYLTIIYTDDVSTPPVASFTVSKNYIRIPNTISLTDTSTNIPTSWSWYWGDGTANTTGTGTPTHEYTKRGKFNIILTATNEGGSDDSDVTTVRVVGYENYY